MKKFLLIFVFALNSFIIKAQSSNGAGILAPTKNSSAVLIEASPASAAMSSERLARIDGLVKEYVDKKWIAGATVLIARNGKIVYYKGLGYDDMDQKIPIKRDAICRIASQTKAITSTAVMILYEEGKFLLDDPISKYIHSFKNPQVLD